MPALLGKDRRSRPPLAKTSVQSQPELHETEFQIKPENMYPFKYLHRNTEKYVRLFLNVIFKIRNKHSSPWLKIVSFFTTWKEFWAVYLNTKIFWPNGVLIYLWQLTVNWADAVQKSVKWYLNWFFCLLAKMNHNNDYLWIPKCFWQRCIPMTLRENRILSNQNQTVLLKTVVIFHIKKKNSKEHSEVPKI